MSKKEQLILITLLSLVSCSRAPFGKVSTGHEGQPLQGLQFVSADTKDTINATTLAPGKSLVLFYMSPTCPFCAAQFQEVIQHEPLFKNTYFVVFASDSSSALLTIAQNANPKHFPNIFFGYDYQENFKNYFNPEAVPYTVVYPSDRKLRAAYIGKMSSKNIEDAINN